MTMVVIFLLLVALCFGPGHGSNLKSPMWYHYFTKSWQSAQAYCQSQHGGDLLTVLSQDELDFMDFTSYEAWLGLIRHNDHFHWDGANEVDADRSWDPGNKDCGLASYKRDRPYSVDCDNRRFFFCKGLVSNVFIPETKKYDDAKSYCESKNSHLTTFVGKTTLQFPGSPLYDRQEFPVWIGLHNDDGSWSWSDGATSDYRNWDSDLGSAPSPGSSDCVTVGSLSKSMSIQTCSEPYPFVCYNPKLVLVQELMSWEQALIYCKNLSLTSSYRLLSVDQNHMDTIMNVLNFTRTNKVWVGLRFLAGSWFWSDEAIVPLPALSPCPGFTLGCGALVLSPGSDPVIKAVDCNEKLNLLCYDPALLSFTPPLSGK